jgi:ribose 5-phosphate isomerase RpiB
MDATRTAPWPTPEDVRQVLEHPAVQAALLEHLTSATAAGTLDDARAIALTERLVSATDG